MSTAPFGSGTRTPERTAPGLMAEDLTDLEQRTRYWTALQHVAGRDVLDIGCGLGHGAAILASAGARSVAGVDAAQEVIEAARATGTDGVTFSVAAADALPFDADSFDVVTCFDLLGPDALEGALAEIARVLRPGGRVLLSPRRAADGVPADSEELAALARAVGERFKHVRTLEERSAAVALVVPEELLDETGPDLNASFGKTFEVTPGRGAVIVGADEPVSVLPLVACASDPIDVQRWSEHFDAQQEVMREQARALQELESARRQVLEVTRRLAESERTAARLPDLIQSETELLAEVSQLRAALTSARAANVALQASPSWRITAPLRQVKNALLGRG